MQKMEEQGRPAAVAVRSQTGAASPAAVAESCRSMTPDGKITIDDFTKIELRVGL